MNTPLPPPDLFVLFQRDSLLIISNFVFQNFILVKDKLGITHIGDLSANDLERVRSLALIELTALFDSHSIMYSSRKPKKKYKGETLILVGFFFFGFFLLRLGMPQAIVLLVPIKQLC
jgi:hypothetical protein